MKTSIKIFALVMTVFIWMDSIASNKTNYQPEPFEVETIGQGKPILFLPGFTASGSVWKETVEHLTVERKSYLFSYAGFNGNEPIEMPWYDTIKNGLIDYVNQNKLTDIIVIGHSMGGNLAVDIAAEFPDRVSKIIIVDALPFMKDVMMPDVPIEMLDYDTSYNQQTIAMSDADFLNMATMMASNMATDKENQETLKKWMVEADRKTWAYGYTDLLKLDLRPKLSNISCETLIIGASFPDVNMAKANYEKQYENLSEKTLIMASDSKHFVMLDEPEWFYKTVNDFLVNGK
ncbi:alpha/beta fold hydrolase [Gillisia limnaea]|uniref:Alpha/beta hydrolase fold containing protein n=1 Tax=Gillisia limnaea (strain DSM 15749 / LMG 21470 / R-8282) TaxID=865937 RepID=H2BXF2_GILLR|nr:alpha/beta hydrolase [Gillisia limnaea]EHQ02034.1 alpha/beta hydrolase fold containing protein [Gillisia limnaea DSM 15749]